MPQPEVRQVVTHLQRNFLVLAVGRQARPGSAMSTSPHSYLVETPGGRKVVYLVSRALGEMHILSFSSFLPSLLTCSLWYLSPSLPPSLSLSKVTSSCSTGHPEPSPCSHQAGRLTWLTPTSLLPGEMGQVRPLSLSTPLLALSLSSYWSPPHQTRVPS